MTYVSYVSAFYAPHVHTKSQQIKVTPDGSLYHTYIYLHSNHEWDNPAGSSQLYEELYNLGLYVYADHPKRWWVLRYLCIVTHVCDVTKVSC